MIRSDQFNEPKGALPKRTLVLVRHGESQGNRKNEFTGWRDVGLTDQGINEAHAVARSLKTTGLKFQAVFSSALDRAKATASIILADLGQTDTPIISDPALNERDYGELTGMNKDEARVRWGSVQVKEWRRSYDAAPPGGESLKDTAARVLPYYIRKILPATMRDGPILVVAHGNSLRALVMVLDGLGAGDIEKVEIATGQVMLYNLAADTTVESHRTLSRSE